MFHTRRFWRREAASSALSAKPDPITPCHRVSHPSHRAHSAERPHSPRNERLRDRGAVSPERSISFAQIPPDFNAASLFLDQPTFMHFTRWHTYGIFPLRLPARGKKKNRRTRCPVGRGGLMRLLPRGLPQWVFFTLITSVREPTLRRLSACLPDPRITSV